MANVLTQYDDWLQDGGPAALILSELLEPVDGPDGVYFPATYAAAEDKSKFAGGYNIDVFPSENALAAAGPAKDARWRPTIEQFPSSPNVCLVDSVGSQANRIEPIFSRPGFCGLVPQVRIKVGDKSINLLDAGHRAGDAVVRFTSEGERIWKAFQSLLDDGNAWPLAEIAPTSLVFGVWDSRGTQAKVARAFRAVIRARNVRMLTRSAQFNRATKYVEEGVIDESLDVGDGDKSPLSREGFKDNPATSSHGGVYGGEIRREVTINLSAIRRLRGAPSKEDGKNEDENAMKLRRYIFGLALVAATASDDGLFDLREGCHLRPKPDHVSTWTVVNYRKKDECLIDLDASRAIEYAKAAASDFGVAAPCETTFDKAAAEKWLALDKKEQDKRRRLGPVTKQAEGDAGSSGGRSSGRRGRGARPQEGTA